ncbi:3306_t:CDS:1, partial [Acaulospora colombiana]
MGFCGSVDKPLNKIYGNLPYIAPEVLRGKQHTQKSDIYSLGILMWEVATGEVPFNYIKHNHDLALAIISGIRPKIYQNIPAEYVRIMKQCWDAIPENRPDLDTINRRFRDLRKEAYKEESQQNKIQLRPSRTY